MDTLRQMKINDARRKIANDFYARPEVIDATAGKMIESGVLEAGTGAASSRTWLVVKWNNPEPAIQPADLENDPAYRDDGPGWAWWMMENWRRVVLAVLGLIVFGAMAVFAVWSSGR